MKKIMLFFFLSVFVFPLAAQPEPPIDLEKTGKRLLDSLQKVGVDTIIEFKTGCKSCLPVNYIIHKVNTDSLYSDFNGVVIPVETATPYYYFWISKGKYFVKKIDQFKIYNTLERVQNHHFPLYDFVWRNTDSAGYWKFKGDKQKERPKIYDSKSNNPHVENDITVINFYSPELKLKEELLHAYFEPVYTGKENYANSRTNYYEAFMSLRFEWKRILESELFILEAKHLFKPEKK